MRSLVFLTIVYHWQRITEMLLNTCTVATSAWVIAEALDAIMDLYSEDDTKYVAAELKLVEKLNSIVLIFKVKVRSCLFTKIRGQSLIVAH